MSITAIDERISELVAAHRPELEHLIDEAIGRQLAALVEERLAARNGNGAAVAPVAVTNVGTKTGNVCGTAKAATEFETGRRTCRLCRRRQERERADRRAQAEAPAEQEPPRQAAAVEAPS